jgi:hypothetical protein
MKVIGVFKVLGDRIDLDGKMDRTKRENPQKFEDCRS